MKNQINMSSPKRNLKKGLFVAFTSLSIILTACESRKLTRTSTTRLIRSDYALKEIETLCAASMETAKKSLDAIAATPESARTIDNTLLAFEKTTADLGDEIMPLTFMSYVSTDTGISAEGAKCEEDFGKFMVEVSTRRDLYQSFAKVKARDKNEERLLQKTKESFEQNGLNLSDEVLAKVRDLKSQLSTLESQYSKNLNTDLTTVTFTADELDGLPADYLASLKKDAAGNFVVSARESDYPLVMQNAKKSDARKKMMLGYLSRAADKNTKLLEDAVVLRTQIAKLMGFKTWADSRTNGRMAQTGANVLEFLNSLKAKLAKRNQDDMARVLKFKQESVPGTTSLDQWDVTYYSNQLQKRDYSLDNEKIREYFPADLVISGMFEIYSKMLGVRFEEIKGAKVWHPSVQLFAIHDAIDDKVIAYFYADFFPRDNKYGHAAAFPIISGRVLPDGKYSLPVASIVSNLNPPMNGKPSLLSHDDVETMFHEFGHIMHQTLTTAPYASLSGSSVAQDFVEAPSQMLENWVWNPEVLNMISGHYLDRSKKLPAEMIQKMLDAKDFNQGYGYTKQMLYGLFDMTIHTQDGPVDVNKTYLDLYRQVMGQEPLAGQSFPASFGHMMGGYDAGYYSYLWSEVYAQDMFSLFPTKDITSPEMGLRYRTNILEPGNMKDASELLRDFLGRQPNTEAFFKKLHI
jgi:thimet oligopeptidase